MAKERPLLVTGQGKLRREYPKYQRGSATSKAAAESVAEKAPTIRESVYQNIYAWGSIGVTTDALIGIFHSYSPSTIRPRVIELHQADRIHPLLDAFGKPVTRPTRTGCQAVVYVAGPATKPMDCLFDMGVDDG